MMKQLWVQDAHKRWLMTVDGGILIGDIGKQWSIIVDRG